MAAAAVFARLASRAPGAARAAQRDLPRPPPCARDSWWRPAGSWRSGRGRASPPPPCRASARPPSPPRAGGSSPSPSTPLPEDAQVLLWHREVEAEGLSVPAALLALDPREAGRRLDEARTLLRAGCAGARQALAPDRECRHFGRLLDLSLRRTGPLIPDIRRHLARCAFCRRSASTSCGRRTGGCRCSSPRRSLGGGAERYLETRPRPPAPPPPEARPGRVPTGSGCAGRAATPGRYGAASRTPPCARPDGGTLLTGLGFALSALLLAAAVSGLWPAADGGDRAAGPQAPPTATAAPPPGTGRSPRGRRRAAGPGCAPPPRTAVSCAWTCGAARGGRGRPDARRVHGGGDPDVAARTGRAAAQCGRAGKLCADSGRPDGSVALAVCGTGPEVRYDVTVRGAVVPRGDAALALAAVTAEPGSDLVVRLREGASEQRWLIDRPGGRVPRTPGRSRGGARPPGGAGAA